MPCYLQTTLTHQLWQVIQLSGLITTNPICVLDNLLYFGSTLIVEWETSQSTISRLRCHTTAIMPYQGYYTISRLQCHQRSKQNPPKTFPVKENCHTIKSAGVHAFHPHLSFCLKLSRFIPAFRILSSFDPYESPPFDISPGDKRGNPRRCCYVSRPTTQRLQQAASQRSALQQ